MMIKPTIAVDIDDVLVDEAEFVIAYSNQTWGHALTLDDYTEHWGELWQVGPGEVERRADALHEPGIKSAYRLIQDAHDTLIALKKQYRLVILTSRRAKVKQETLDWLETNFADVFSEIRFTGFYDTRSADRHTFTKGDILVEMGVSYLIDDQLKHCLGAAERGLEVILFGTRSLPQGVTLPSNIAQCPDWKSVKAYFNHASPRS